MKKHLYLRLQRDARMDLCEAYVLCLIDEIAGVVNADSIELEGQRLGTVETPRLTPTDLSEVGGQEQAVNERSGSVMS